MEGTAQQRGQTEEGTGRKRGPTEEETQRQWGRGGSEGDVLRGRVCPRPRELLFHGGDVVSSPNKVAVRVQVHHILFSCCAFFAMC